MKKQHGGLEKYISFDMKVAANELVELVMWNSVWGYLC